MKQRKKGITLFCVLGIILTLAGCSVPSDHVDYSQRKNWAVCTPQSEKPADVFWVGPTVYTEQNETHRMPLEDESAKRAYTEALNAQIGIYEESCRVFAPFYRQAALSVYEMEQGEGEIYISGAYHDVSEAFAYYLKHYNQGRPIVLAGFSQGADHCIRLLQEYGENEELLGQVVAVYAIGWRLTEETCQEYPWVKPAEGELDLGAVICFDAEAESVQSSPVVEAGQKTHSINPLNWRTDARPASAAQNMGAVFVDGNGAVRHEISQFCGAYIDPARGTLKVTGINAADYCSGLSMFEKGAYHQYNCSFFYQNLKQNVENRCAVYLEKSA